MREQRQAAPFLKLPLAGYEETFKRAVDGRTCKGRKIGVFRRPLIYEPDSENVAERTERSEGVKPVWRPAKAQMKTRQSPESGG